MGCVSSISVSDIRPTNINKKQTHQLIQINDQNVQIQQKKPTFLRKRTKKIIILNNSNLFSDKDLIQHSQPSDKIIEKNKFRGNPLKEIHKKITMQEIITLNNILSQHYFFYSLKKQQKITFIQELKLYQVSKGRKIYQKGETPQKVYILKDGLLQVQTFNKEFPSNMIKKNTLFGQMDIIFDTERTHTILAKENSKLWAIQRWKINRLHNQSKQLQSAKKTYLKKVSMFSYLSDEEIDSLGQKIFMFKYRPGYIIFQRGDSSDKLFVIISGEVEIQIPNKNNMILRSGEVFGESCLKQSPLKRAGTAISYSQCRCLVISRRDFFQCLGDDHVENIAHFSILKWAFKRSQKLKDESNRSCYKIFKKGKTKYLKDGKNIFENNQNELDFTIVSLQGSINQFGVGVLINCSQTGSKTFTKHGDGNVFILQNKLLNQTNHSSKKMFKLKPKIQSTLSIKRPLKQDSFEYENLQDFMKELTLVQILRSLDGGKGDYYHVHQKQTQRFYNIWCLKKYQIQENQIAQRIINQKNILTKTSNSHFLSKFYRTFNDTHHIYFVFKSYPHGSLQQLTIKQKQFNRDTIIFFTGCMIVGIQQMHLKMKIMHRNICLQNVLIQQSGYLCIDNFQNAKIISQKDPRTHTILGTPQYLAPQIVSGNGYSFQVDYWALGVIIYRIVFGKFPFANSTNDPFQIFKHIIKNKPDYKAKQNVDPQLVQFIRMLLFTNPKHRVPQTATDIRNHSIFEDFDWQQLQKKNIIPPFNLDKLVTKVVDKKHSQETKNYFSTFLSKQKKKIQQQNKKYRQNFKSWDFHFN